MCEQNVIAGQAGLLCYLTVFILFVRIIQYIVLQFLMFYVDHTFCMKIWIWGAVWYM